MRVLLEKRYNLAKGKGVVKTYILKQKTWDLVKLILDMLAICFNRLFI